jgi:hypothetical protein
LRTNLEPPPNGREISVGLQGNHSCDEAEKKFGMGCGRQGSREPKLAGPDFTPGRRGLLSTKNDQKA